MLFNGSIFVGRSQPRYARSSDTLVLIRYDIPLTVPVLLHLAFPNYNTIS